MFSDSDLALIAGLVGLLAMGGFCGGFAAALIRFVHKRRPGRHERA
jgi:hypothetical protein